MTVLLTLTSRLFRRMVFLSTSSSCSTITSSSTSGFYGGLSVTQALPPAYLRRCSVLPPMRNQHATHQRRHLLECLAATKALLQIRVVLHPAALAICQHSIEPALMTTGARPDRLPLASLSCRWCASFFAAFRSSCSGLELKCRRMVTMQWDMLLPTTRTDRHCGNPLSSHHLQSTRAHYA